MFAASSASWALSALAPVLAFAQTPASDLPTVTLPGAERALAALSPSTAPARLDLADLPESPEDPRWDQPAAWERWADALLGESASDVPDARRRADLCLLARATGRWNDAWRHWQRAQGDPAVLAALLPALLPGLAPSDLASLGAPGGVPGPLPAGVLLAPALPPEIEGAGYGRLERRSMRIDGLRVGAAVIGVRVRVESEGVQIDLEHQGGEAASVRVLLPEPEGFEITSVYLDWYRQDAGRGPYAVLVEPGQEEPRALFARCRPRTPSWPTRLPARLPAQDRLRGLAVVAGDGRGAGLAAALARLLDVPTRWVAQASDVPEGALAIDLARAPDPDRLARRVMAMTEERLLGLR